MKVIRKYYSNTIASFFLAFAITLYFSKALYSQDMVRSGRGFRTEVTHELNSSAQGSLELFSIVGDVEVNSWKENKVKIVEKIYLNVFSKKEAEKLYPKYTLSIKESGDLISASGPKYYPGKINIDYSVTLPENFKADISTSGGDFIIKNLKGEYKFKTSGGDVSLGMCEGDIFCSTSGGDLELKNVNGSLTASTSGGDISCADCQSKIDLKTSGGDLDLSRLKGKISARTSGGDIVVSNITGTLEVKTSGGDIDLRQIESEGLVIATTSGGDIDVSYIKADVEVKTSGGQINADNVKGGLIANTSGGDIEVMSHSGNCKLSTSGGDVLVDGADGYIEVNTSGGDVEAEIIKFSPNLDQHITLSSSGGDLILTLPANFQGTVDARIEIMGGNLDEYDIYSDFPLKVSKESSSASGRPKFLDWSIEGAITGTGNINGGGNKITLQTSNGDISIKKK